MSGIVRLASFPKSGNSWMRSFLHNLSGNPTESYDINTFVKTHNALLQDEGVSLEV